MPAPMAPGAAVMEVGHTLRLWRNKRRGTAVEEVGGGKWKIELEDKSVVTVSANQLRVLDGTPVARKASVTMVPGLSLVLDAARLHFWSSLFVNDVLLTLGEAVYGQNKQLDAAAVGFLTCMNVRKTFKTKMKTSGAVKHIDNEHLPEIITCAREALMEQLVDVLEGSSDIKDALDEYTGELSYEGVKPVLQKAGVKDLTGVEKDWMLWSSVAAELPGCSEYEKETRQPAPRELINTRIAVQARAFNDDQRSPEVARMAVQLHVFCELEGYLKWEVGQVPDEARAREFAVRRVLSNVMPPETATMIAGKVSTTGPVENVIKAVLEGVQRHCNAAEKQKRTIPKPEPPAPPAVGKEKKENKGKEASSDAKGGKKDQAKASAGAGGATLSAKQVLGSERHGWSVLQYMMTRTAGGAAAPVAKPAAEGNAAPAQAFQPPSRAPAAASSNSFNAVWNNARVGHTTYSWTESVEPRSDKFSTIWGSGSAPSVGHTTDSWSNDLPGSSAVHKAEAKQAKPKKEKAAPKAAAAPPAERSFGDVTRLDIRVGVITNVWKHPDSDKLWCEEIDIGEPEPRKIASGLQQIIPMEQMKGARVVVLANLKEKKLGGFPSHGMVLCANPASEDGKVELLIAPEGAKVGERVTFPGHDGEADPVLSAKKNKDTLLEVGPHLYTEKQAGGIVATYKGSPFTTSAGPVICKTNVGGKVS
mmetsp:Transcript_18730/g.45891  ORF Transcript_18730/g.45891 Transcript_18730/m.45891 type:complete len:703 (+) Transcript_18730:84-2192(+)